MSKLVVEVCRIDKMENHPNADRLEICRIKGWAVVVGKNTFAEGDKCVFFPPDSVLPSPLIERLDIRKYLHALPKSSNQPDAGRVVAARLRGEASFGTIMPLDASKGDNLDWGIGTDVAEHFGVTKYEPPAVAAEGLADTPCSKFYSYTDIENFANYVDAIPEGTEVVYTEKIHGKNCRVGLVLDSDGDGNSQWTFMAGSHDIRRKEFVSNEKQVPVENLIEAGACKDVPKVDDILLLNGRHFLVKDILASKDKKDKEILKAHLIGMVQNAESADNITYTPSLVRSEFWAPLTDNIKKLLEYVETWFDYPEQKYSIMLYGELYGAGVQDMQYGMHGVGFRAFDISINNKYLNYDAKANLFAQFNVAVVPILYRGPHNAKLLEEYTSGPTTLCSADEAGKFKGREGVVVTPVEEVHYCPVLNKRQILKSVSADYHARKGGTEFH